MRTEIITNTDSAAQHTFGNKILWGVLQRLNDEIGILDDIDMDTETWHKTVNQKLAKYDAHGHVDDKGRMYEIEFATEALYTYCLLDLNIK